MYDHCVWKQLIKILLPVSYLTFSLLIVGEFQFCTGSSGLDSQKQVGSSQLDNTTDSTPERSHKVKAKWKGEQFWAEAVANLTQLELERLKSLESPAMTLQSNSTKRSSLQSSLTSNPTVTFKNKGLTSPSKLRSTLHSGNKRSKTENNSFTNTTQTTTTSTSTPSKVSTKPTISHRTTTTPTKKTSHSHKSSKATKAKGKTKSKTKSKPKTPRPKVISKFTLAPKTELERATLIADLAPFQDYYLEYHSDEVDEPNTNETTTTEMPNRNSTDGKNSSLSIAFYPKTPVNLLYLLQAYASNMKPIKLESPIPGGPSATVPVPISIPVKVNPPNSPFLFNLDLDSFFTRMAISFFYSSIAIAPLIYMMIGGLGSLGGLSIVPFTGKKRRKRRDVHESNFIEVFENFEEFQKQFKKNFNNLKI